MNFTTLINTLENTLTRTITSLKNNPNTIAYKGDITSVTINNTDTYTNVYQLILTPNNNDVNLTINHTSQRHTTTIPINNITSLTIT